MNNHPGFKTLNDCGCCEGQTVNTPHRIDNRHGLTTIAYRAGNYHAFKASMLARLSSSTNPQLYGLTTRQDHDFSIALIDAWSVVSEVLCFYQEYFANESLLRTAKERLSVLEHARLIGYRLHPGVAASGHIAFTLDEPLELVNNPVLETTIAAGAKIQSTPGPDESAQLYETEHAIKARVDWNAMRPRMTQPQIIHAAMPSVVIDGITTFIKPGDELLLIDANDNRYIKKVREVMVDDVLQTTQLIISSDEVSPGYHSMESSENKGNFSHFDNKDAIDDEVINTLINESWSIQDINAVIDSKHWDIDEVMQKINSHEQVVKNAGGLGVYGFHQRVNLFGYNAQKQVEYDAHHQPKKMSEWLEWPASETAGNVYLDTAQPEIVSGSFLLINRAEIESDGNIIHQAENISAAIQQAVVTSRTAYGMSSKTSCLQLNDHDVFFEDGVKDMQIIRGSSIQAQSEVLPLIQVPINEKISGDRILLEKADLNLQHQQYVVISGERCDLPGVIESEVVQIAQTRLEHGFTLLVFTTSLTHEYHRHTVKINANVAAVSHGESVSEVLGSGDASLSSQSFTLKQTPLCYVSADAPTGVSSTLAIRVNDILWHEVESLLNKQSDEQVYTTKIHDDGSCSITFGDGIEGARLPSGNHNVVAYYRKGIGLDGLVDSTQLNVLLTRPLGVKDAVNPLPSSGADGAEQLADARVNAPLGLLTLGRAVSLQDYEDYSRSFAGIRKARAVTISQQGVAQIYITLAGPNGALVEPASKTYKNLLAALRNSGDPYVQFSLLSYRPAYFKLDAELSVHPDYSNELVMQSVHWTLRETFCFDARDFNQAVHLSEVISTIQRVEGVIAVDVNYLYRSDANPVSPPPRTLMPHISSSSGQVLGAELLTLDPAPLDQIKVKA